MELLQYLKKSIQNGGNYLLKNKDHISFLLEILDQGNLSKEDKNFIEYVKGTLLNLKNISDKRIYRGVFTSSFSKKREIDNYVNSLEEASLYGEGIVLEYYYDYGDTRVKEEEIVDRKEGNVIQYDKIIQKEKLDGIKWYVGNGNFFYRLKTELLDIKRVYYVEDNLKENISLAIKFTRKYLGLSQSDFAKILGINQSKLSEYESGKREISIENIIHILKNLPVEQVIQYKNNSIIIK